MVSRLKPKCTATTIVSALHSSLSTYLDCIRLFDVAMVAGAANLQRAAFEKAPDCWTATGWRSVTAVGGVNWACAYAAESTAVLIAVSTSWKSLDSGDNY